MQLSAFCDRVCVCVRTQHTPAACVRACNRSGKTVCQRKMGIRLECWSPGHLSTGNPDLFWEVFLHFLQRGILEALHPLTPIYPLLMAASLKILSIIDRIISFQDTTTATDTPKTYNDLLQKNNGAVFIFPFEIPFGLLCFFSSLSIFAFAL